MIVVIDFPIRKEVDVDVKMLIDEKLYELEYYIEIKYYDKFNNICEF